MQNVNKAPDGGGKSIKKLLKKWWFWVIAILLICMIGNSSETQDTAEVATEPQTITQSSESEENAESSESTTTAVIAEVSRTEELIEAVKEAIKDYVTEDEVITDVTLIDGDLRVHIDMSNADPTPLTREDIVWSCTTGITDAILDISDYDDEWTTITVDCGDWGRITNSKDNIEVNEYGGRYFKAENFVIETE